jgi:hypothetical protein
VLDLVGPGEWRFVAEVSTEFMTTYRKVAPTQSLVYVFDQEVRHADEFEPGEEEEDSYWHLCPKKVLCEPQHTTYAARFASISRVKATYQEWLRLTPITMFFLGLVGDLQILDLLDTDGRLGVHKAAGVAASSSIEKLEWLCDHCINDRNKVVTVLQILRVSARASNLQVFEWVWNRYGTAVADIEVSYLQQLARKAGSIDLCMFLKKDDSPWIHYDISEAVAYGHYELVCWMLSTLGNKTPDWDYIWIGQSAAVNGRIAILEKLFEHTTGHSDLIRAAGYGDQKEAIQWSRARGIRWPDGLSFEGVPWSADMVEWARAQGCDSYHESDE